MALQLTTTPDPNAAIIESLALRGDISGLTPAQKVDYYRLLCERCGLDPTTQPFLPLKLNGKEILYAARAATDQLAKVHAVTRTITNRERVEDVWVVTARAALPTGRAEESIGAVPIAGLKGEALANALMKGETKAKRRATLSLCGLGLLDESEIETIPARAIEAVPPINITPHPEPLPARVVEAAGDPAPEERPEVTRILALIEGNGQSRESLEAWLSSTGRPPLAELPVVQLERLASQLEKSMRGVA